MGAIAIKNNENTLMSYEPKRAMLQVIDDEFELFENRQFNLFSPNIFKKYLIFRGDDQSSINEFWSYFLLERHYESDVITRCVSLIYKIASLSAKLQIKSFIVFEENEENLYFTVKHASIINRGVVLTHIEKQGYCGDYRIRREKLSFQIQKAKPKQIEEDLCGTLDAESMRDLQEQIRRINSIILCFQFGVEREEDILELSHELSSVASTLSQYTKIYEISTAIKTLSIDLRVYRFDIISNTASVFRLLDAFGQDFERWVEETLQSHKPSVDALSDMLITNINIISGFIKPSLIEDEQAIENVFNF